MVGLRAGAGAVRRGQWLNNQNLAEVKENWESTLRCETLGKCVLMCTGRADCALLSVVAEFAYTSKYLEFGFVRIWKRFWGARIFSAGAKSCTQYLVINTRISKSVVSVISESEFCRGTSGVLDPCSCGEKAARCHDARLTPQHNPVLSGDLLCLDWAQEAHPAWCVSPAHGHSTRSELLHPNHQALVSCFLQCSGKQNAAQRANTPVVWFCTVGWFWFCLSLASKDGKKKPYLSFQNI